MYTKEQAEKDKVEFERMAEEADERGDCMKAGIYRVEASNCMDRVGMKKAHKVNLGPYSAKNPCRCMDCGMWREQWNYDYEECVPKTIKIFN